MHLRLSRRAFASFDAQTAAFRECMGSRMNDSRLLKSDDLHDSAPERRDLLPLSPQFPRDSPLNFSFWRQQ